MPKKAPSFWIHHYVLRSASALNAASTRQEFPGALIRDEQGFACLHPWPELGDLPLTHCLQDLAEEQISPLVKRALHCARADGEARADGRALTASLEAPLSHATLPQWDRDFLKKSTASGFSMVKLKSPDLETLRLELAHHPELRFRLDLNSTSDPARLLAAFSNWSPEEKKRIDFLEDPTFFDPSIWRNLRDALGIPLANDRAAALDEDSEFLVLKPALDDFTDFAAHPARQIFTSYMDHPLGQCFAAYEAARSGTQEICGLQTQDLFEKDHFIEQLGPAAPKFTFPEGHGLGFDELLEALPWKKL